MEELKKLTVELLKMIDAGDLMGCYSLFETDIREILTDGDLDQTDEFIKLWNVQMGYVNEEDWASVMENIENIRPLV
jgi:hypothetical protein